MAAAHSAAQRAGYSLPPPPGALNDDLRLPSIRDLHFPFPNRHRQEPPVENPPAYEQSPSPIHERSARHPQTWSRPTHHAAHPVAPPSSNHVHQPHPQHHAPPLSASHETPSRHQEYTSRHGNDGYVTPGIPLSAQTTPIPGSVNTGPTMRNDEYQQHGSNKRIRANDRTPVVREPRTSSQTNYSYSSYGTGMAPPSSPYHQSSPVSAVHPPTHPAQPNTPSADSSQQHRHPAPNQTYGSYQTSYIPPPRPAPITHSAPPSNVHHAPPPPPPPPTSHHPPNSTPYTSPTHPNSHWDQPPAQTPLHQPPAIPVSQQSHDHPPQHYHNHTPQHQHQHQSQHQHQHQHQPQHQPQHHYSHPPPPPVVAAPTPAPPPPSSHVAPQQYHHQAHQPHGHPAPLPHAPNHSHTHPPAPVSAPAPPTYQQPVQVHEQQPAPQQAYPKSTSINPAQLDARGPYADANVNPQPVAPPVSHERPPISDPNIAELSELCTSLYDFANRYAQPHGAMPHVVPTSQELSDMASCAHEIVRILEDLGRDSMAMDEDQIKNDSDGASVDDHRPPKRPWEDMAQDGQDGDSSGQYEDSYEDNAVPPQNTAEADMELIRTKRATTTAGASSSTQPKSKYRKRSSSMKRASPPGRCHSCNIRETPEWRRGPDGARTLCNACGLHYAKLMRKQSKLGNGESPNIDMEMLRASTRAAEAEKSNRSKVEDTASSSGLAHHQGFFQVSIAEPSSTSPTTAESSSSRVQEQANPPLPTVATPSHPPPPPWQSLERQYAPEQVQHQSYIRSSVQDTSSR